MTTTLLGADAELLVAMASSLSAAAAELRRCTTNATMTLRSVNRIWPGVDLAATASRWAETSSADLLRRAQLLDEIDSVRGLINSDIMAAERRAFSAWLDGDTREARRWDRRAERSRELLAPRAVVGRWGAITFEHRQFLVFDPANGRIAELVGDLGSASAVAVLVPGTKSNLGNFDRTAERARLMHATASDVNCSDVAVIAWLGYDAPDNLWQARHIEPAAAGGIQLASFLESLADDMQPGARITLVGHSYGTDVVAKALLAGARADAALFLGSPGVPVNHARELNRAGTTEIYAMRSIGDPIPFVNRDPGPVVKLQPVIERLLDMQKAPELGMDPTLPEFGATRLDAGTDQGHDAYFVAGSVAMAQIGALIAGSTNRLRDVTADTFAEGWEEKIDDTIDNGQAIRDIQHDARNVSIDELQTRLGPGSAGIFEVAQGINNIAHDATNGTVDTAQRGLGTVSNGVDRIAEIVDKVPGASHLPSLGSGDDLSKIIDRFSEHNVGTPSAIVRDLSTIADLLDLPDLPSMPRFGL